MTESEIAKLVSSQKTSIAKLLKIGKDELSNLLDDGVHDYLENQRLKYEQMKTFLFRNDPVKFKDIYFPLSLKNEKNKINDSFDLMKRKRYLTIVGEAGSGKSMLMTYIFHKCIEENYKIPLLIELRNLKYSDSDLNKYILNEILRNKIKPSDTIVNRAFENGGFVFLFDGYDEISSEDIAKVSYQLEKFVDTFPKNQFVITTRPGTSAERFARFNNWNVEGLDNSQIKSFTKQQVSLMSGEISLDKISEDIFKTENAQFLHFLQNPLLLSMFIYVYRYNPELPKTKSKFYQNVFDTLCTKHDSITKGGSYLHDLKSKVSREDIEIILSWFSYISFFEERYSFDEQYFKEILKKIKTQLNLKLNLDDFIFDLQVNISLIVRDGVELKFPHRSIQEYFSALLIHNQSEENKRKIYSKMLSGELIVYSDLNNFFSICYEIDKRNIIKYLFIPLLKEFWYSIKLKNENDDIVKQYYAKLEIEADYRVDYKGGLLNNVRHSMWFPKIVDEVFSFFKLDIDCSGLFISKIPIKNLPNSLLNRTKLRDTMSEHLIGKTGQKDFLNISFINDYEDLKSTILSYGIKSKLNKFHEELEGRIWFLEKELESMNRSASNLLGI